MGHDQESTDIYDDEYLQELQQQALTEVNQANSTSQQKKLTSTYLSSEIPVRPCTDTCPHRGTCKDYLSGKVATNAPCKPELRKIKKWQVAFRKGDLESLKDDVGTVAGSLAVQIIRLLDAVNEDGVVVETTKFINGEPYTEKIAHPAIAAATRLAKDLGIDMSEFLMTPKAARGAPPPVQVNIGVSAEEVKARFSARFGTDAKQVDDS